VLFAGVVPRTSESQLLRNRVEEMGATGDTGAVKEGSVCESF